MPTVNIHEAKTHLSRLIDQVAGGETVIIAKAGKPMVKLVPIDPPAKPKRLRFLAGYGKIPDDFDTIGHDEILKMFEGEK